MANENTTVSYIDPRGYKLCPDYYIRNLPDVENTFPKGPCPRCDFVNDGEGEITIATSIQTLNGEDCWGVSILHTDDDEKICESDFKALADVSIPQTTKPYRTFLYAHYQEGGYVNRYKRYDDDDEPFEFIKDYRTLVCGGEEGEAGIKTTILQYMRPGDILEIWMYQCDGFMVEYHNLLQSGKLSSTVEQGFNNGDIKLNYAEDYGVWFAPQYKPKCLCKKLN